MCIPVSPKNVAGNCGTVHALFLYAAAAQWPGTAGNIGSVRPSAISLLHSRPWRITNAVPQAIVARSHQRCALSLPNTAARTASTMVKELVSRNAVIRVALRMLSEWNGVGQFGVEMRP